MITTQTILALILAYLLGSIPSAVWIGKLFFGVDVRTKGSGNAGATNAIRVLGWKAGIPVLLFDICKGWGAVSLSYFLHKGIQAPDQMIYFQIMLAFLVVLGHVFPLFAGFRGGKGVATLLGVGIALFPYPVIVCLGIFILVLILTKYVSLSSITAAIAFPFVEVFLFGQTSLPLILMAVGVALFIPLTHKKNIQRLLKNEEKRFTIRNNKG